MTTLKERFAAKKAQKQQQQTARLLKPATLSLTADFGTRERANSRALASYI